MTRAAKQPNPKPNPVYLDDADHTAYFLGFDLLLVRAQVRGPIQGGVALIEGAATVERITSDRSADAYHAVIRTELLRKFGAVAWQSEIDSEQALAQAFCEESELEDLPSLDRGRIASLIFQSVAK